MDLKISIIQTDIYWEDVEKNLDEFTKKIKDIREETDIIVLPEMFNTGFSMRSKKLAEKMDEKTLSWMKERARDSNAVIVGSLIIEDDIVKNRFYNRLVWMQPDAIFYTYDKRHLFRMANEHQSFTDGKTRLIVDYKGWKICPLICYDLRFPVWSRNKKLPIDNRAINSESTNTNAYDCLIYIACWPEARKQPWSKLLEARAIENQCYVVGVNRVGKDGNDITYSGNSVVINPKGEVILSAPENQNCSLTTSLNLNELNNFRAAFPVGEDGDDFEIIG
ncbi:MAG: amidohydrolase [Vicingus serpentipes]|nr:amidohydrolase [Vicingus serpentipes]